MTTPITSAELACESVELLEQRQALSSYGPHWASVYASNAALAFNAGSHNSMALASAGQHIKIWQ